MDHTVITMLEAFREQGYRVTLVEFPGGDGANAQASAVDGRGNRHVVIGTDPKGVLFEVAQQLANGGGGATPDLQL